MELKAHAVMFPSQQTEVGQSPRCKRSRCVHWHVALVEALQWDNQSHCVREGTGKTSKRHQSVQSWLRAVL